MEVSLQSQPSTSRENRMEEDAIDCGFQVGRIANFWKGKYELERDIASNDEGSKQSSLKYYLIKTVETDEDFCEKTFYTCVPTTWVSLCKTFMLYPPVGMYSVSGRPVEPLNWKSTIFKRFRLPNRDNWFEYDIVHIYNIKKPGSHDRVHKAAVAAMKGTDNFEDILKSDNDSSLGRGNKLKKKKNFDLPDPIEIPRKKKKTVASVSKSHHRCELEKVTEKSMDGATDIEHVDVNEANLNKSENSLEEQQAEASNFGYPRLERNWDENSSNSVERDGSTTPVNTSGLFDPISPTTDVLVDLSLDRVNTLQDMNDNFQRQRIMHKSFTDTDQTLSIAVLECLERLSTMQDILESFSTKFLAIMDKLTDLERKVEEIREVDMFKKAKNCFAHHNDVIKSHFKDLPVKSTQAVEALNVALKDEKLAVSLVFFLIEKMQTAKTVNAFVKLMFSFLISDVTSNAMQWKMCPRGKDNRPGLAGLHHLLAVFGVAVIHFAQKKGGEVIKVARLQQLVRDARKVSSRFYRSKANHTDEPDADDNATTDVGATAKQDCDSVLLQGHIEKLNAAVSKFTL